MTLDDFAHIGQIMGGFAFLITAIVATVTLLFVHRKQLDDAWLDRFRNLYAEFWNDKDMVYSRGLITNKLAYDGLEVILKKRNSHKECDMTLDEYKVLEAMDKFCSIMARVRSFAMSIAMSEVQEDLWGDLLYNFWMLKINNRIELKKYVEIHWNKLLIPVVIKRKKQFILF